MQVAMMGMPGPAELGIILAIVFVVFGPKRLPQFGKAIGETIREFRGVKKQLTEAHEEVKDIDRTVRREVDDTVNRP